ncbi:MAG TPA: thioredoxin [Dysgonamonadaceae bacterium]|nr:thioredoxin [Dysgonamonadaceae bacterium]
MKKRLLIISVLTAMILTACSNVSNDNKQKENSQQTESKMQTKQKTINLTKAEFLTKVANYEESPDKWEYLGDKPCLIDFYADWCGPCKMVAPILEELADEYEGEIYIYKVDTEAEQELAAAFGIRSIPSILFCPMGEQPQMAQGALPKDGFIQAIDEVLLKKS